MKHVVKKAPVPRVRPQAKPALKHYIDTSVLDKNLSSYDAIRKSLK